ncbi:MAG: DUF2878 domain-containing protein [Dokdonella sp.]
MNTRAGIWINAITFQIVWICAVAGAAYGVAWAGPLAVALFATYQLRVSRSARNDACLIGFALVLGSISDSFLAHAQIVQYASPWPNESFAPIWILALWVSLALTLNHSLAFLKRNLYVGALLGALGAPLSYLIAARAWHAVWLAEPLARTLLILATLWAVATPILCALARMLAQRTSPPALAATSGARS